MAKFTATLNDETIEFDASDYEISVSALVARHGGGVPVVAPLEPAPETLTEWLARQDATPEPPASEPTDTQRAKRDEAAAEGAGFALGRPLFSLGTPVVELGHANARASRAAFEALPSLPDAALEFAGEITRERRRDRLVAVDQIRALPSGAVAVRNQAGIEHTSAITREAFRGLTSNRLGISHAGYLDHCDPDLRAYNVNRWIMRQPQTLATLRVRDSADGKGREIFAVVSDSYQGGVSVSDVASIAAESLPADTRAEIDYDGRRVQIDAQYHSDVEPERYVCGEIFKAGVRLTAADDGTGGIKVSAFLIRNLCLNLIVLDRSEIEVASLRHIGDRDGLREAVAAATRKASASIQHFTEAWGKANQERLFGLADEKCVTVEDLLGGIFMAQLRSARELAAVRGRKPAIVAGLLGAVARDERRPDRPEAVTRAHVVNAWTRYAHESVSDPFARGVIESAAGRMLSSRLGWEPRPS